MPVELETLVVGTLGTDSDAGRVRTAAAVRNVVDEVVAEADRVVLFPPEHDGVPPEPGDVWQPRSAVAKQADPRRRRKLAVGLAGLGLCVLAVAGYMSVQLGELFGDPTPRIVVGSSAPPARAGEAVRRPPRRRTEPAVRRSATRRSRPSEQTSTTTPGIGTTRARSPA